MAKYRGSKSLLLRSNDHPHFPAFETFAKRDHFQFRRRSDQALQPPNSLIISQRVLKIALFCWRDPRIVLRDNERLAFAVPFQFRRQDGLRFSLAVRVLGGKCQR